MSSEVTYMFQRAERKAKKLKMALVGETQTGKTYSSLAIASGLGKRTALIDTEHGSSDWYDKEFEFCSINLTDHHPNNFIEAMQAAVAQGFDTVIIDSFSHEWTGKRGILELVDEAAKRSRNGDSFSQWRDATPLHNSVIDCILALPIHVIACMRRKTEYVYEFDEAKKKNVPREVGLRPIQREGVEFEFDLIGELNSDNEMTISKSRLLSLKRGTVEIPTAETGKRFLEYLAGGAIVRLNRDELMSGTTDLMKQIGWNNKQGKEYLESNFGKVARADLTTAQLEKFYDYLQSQSKPSEATFMMPVPVREAEQVDLDEEPEQEASGGDFAISESDPIRRQIYQEIDALMQDLQWTSADLARHLKSKFKKSDMTELTDGELSKLQDQIFTRASNLGVA